MALAQPRKVTKLCRLTRLAPGDTVALIAPASPPQAPSIFRDMRALLCSRGFEVELGKHAKNRRGFLAGDDAARLSDLNAAIRAKRVRAIVCVRGGYGVTRILDRIDFAALRADPKIIVGCSDITALLCGSLLESSVPALHGPMPQSLCNGYCPRFTVEHLFDTLTAGPRSLGSILQGYDEKPRTIQTLRRGRVSGQLIGGNLSLLCSLIGTRHFPSFSKKILCLEDIGEAPYRIDRLLTHLLSLGALDSVAGFALGQFINCSYPPEAARGKQTTLDVLIERLAPLGKPVVVGLPFGHGRYNATLPLGAKATLDAGRGDLIVESRIIR